MLIGTLSKYDDDDNDKEKKNNWFYKQNNNSARASRFLVHFFTVHCTTTNVKRPNVTFYGGRGHTTTNFFFSIWTGIKPLRIQLQEKSPTFDELSGSKERDKVWKNANSLF